MTRRTAIFSGHVQGVGFRFVTRQIASSFDMKGYVRNLPDGRVELVAEGEKREIEALLDAISEKMHGYVDQVTQSESAATGEFRGLEIRR